MGPEVGSSDIGAGNVGIGSAGENGLFTPEELDTISQHIAGFIMQVWNDYRELGIYLSTEMNRPETLAAIQQTPSFRNPLQDPEASEGVQTGARVAVIVGIYGMIVRGKMKGPSSRSAWRLLGANKAKIDRRKLVEYALNPNHPVGGNKAKVFDSALGFNLSNTDDLLRQLREGVINNTPIAGKVDKYGARFTVDIPVTGPLGSGVVRTGWIYRPGSNVPEMTTLFVK